MYAPLRSLGSSNVPDRKFTPTAADELGPVVAMVVVAIYVGFIGFKMGANGGRHD